MKKIDARLEIEKLWIDTFHDSPDYVKLIFDSYYNPELSAYREENGAIVSSLLGVPYEFVNAETGVSLKGLYLCGLATLPSERRKGIMSALIEEINDKAQSLGFDFTFLIPDGEEVGRYYEDRKYVNAFYYIDENYVKGHKFEDSNAVEFEEFHEALKTETIEYLFNLEAEMTVGKESFRIRHSRFDWEVVLKEALIYGAPVFVLKKEGKITGVAFVKEGKKEFDNPHFKKTLTVKELISDDAESENIMLGRIMKRFPDYGLKRIVNCRQIADTQGVSQVWKPFYVQSNGQNAEYEDVSEIEVPNYEATRCMPKGMIRVFDMKRLLKKIGMDDENALEGFANDELCRVALRPAVSLQDTLERVLNLPDLSFGISLMLE